MNCYGCTHKREKNLCFYDPITLLHLKVTSFEYIEPHNLCILYSKLVQHDSALKCSLVVRIQPIYLKILIHIQTKLERNKMKNGNL